jgi:hypothetical protein
LSNKFAIHCTIDELASNLGLNTLSSRRKFIDISFIYKILNDQINCPEILGEIGWLITTFYSRSKLTFNEPFHSQLYCFNDFNFDEESKLRLLCLSFK